MDEQSQVDVGLGLSHNRLPSCASELAERTGLSSQARSVWTSALTNGRWPDAHPIEPVSLSERNTARQTHELLMELVEEISEADQDMGNAYCYATSPIGSILFCGPTTYVWRENSWFEVADAQSLSVEAVSAVLGAEFDVLIGTEHVGTLSELEVAEHPVLSAERMQDWLEETELDDLPELTGASGWNRIAASPKASGMRLFATRGSGSPTGGPPAPDPHCAFHRVRILALRLAREGFEVMVDWGPFEQMYDWAMSDAANGLAVRLVSQEADARFWSADGKRGVLILAGETDVRVETRVRQLVEDFGLTSIFYRI